MCGITGVISFKKRKLNADVLKSMCDVISHRGPDDAGYLVGHTGQGLLRDRPHFEYFTDQQFSHINRMLPCIDARHGQHALTSNDWDLFLGHRRLSIIDTTSAGHQPMSNISKDIWVVYNGEIYNFEAIKLELISLGYAFQSKTDTEVLIYAYQEWGIACVKRFNGMFAFALWDIRKKALYLARDRYGIKPLYYTSTAGGEFIFASEVKSILQYPSYQMQVDKEALVEYFTFQNIFTDKTLYQDVKLLQAGHLAEIDLTKNEANINLKQYWDFDFTEPENPSSEAEYTEELDRLFKQAVQRQLVSDVEIGSYLSGGMDSGSITAIAAKQIPYLKTFTVGFDLNNISGLELSFDERAKSELLSYQYKTEHYEMVLKSGDMERCMRDFSWHLEEPRVGQSYPNFYAAKLASKFVKVVLSGAGGDELFGGYPWRYYRTVNNSSFEDYIDKYYAFWQRLIPNSQLKEVFAPIYDEVKHVWTRDIFRDVFNTHMEKLTRPEDYINHSLYFEAKTFLHGLLVVEDKLSMAHSLETRVPFLDNDLVDFAMKVPVNLKLANLSKVVRLSENEVGSKTQKYFQKTSDGKLILRKALSKYMPEEFTKAPKQGFSSPDESWFKGDSIEFVQDKLLNVNAALYEFFDFNVTSKLIGDHLHGVKNRRLFIWGLLNVEQWIEQYASIAATDGRVSYLSTVST